MQQPLLPFTNSYQFMQIDGFPTSKQPVSRRRYQNVSNDGIINVKNSQKFRGTGEGKAVICFHFCTCEHAQNSIALFAIERKSSDLFFISVPENMPKTHRIFCHWEELRFVLHFCTWEHAQISIAFFATERIKYNLEMVKLVRVTFCGGQRHWITTFEREMWAEASIQTLGNGFTREPVWPLGQLSSHLCTANQFNHFILVDIKLKNIPLTGPQDIKQIINSVMWGPGQNSWGLDKIHANDSSPAFS